MNIIANHYYTRTEACYRLGVSNSSMYVLEQTGKIQAAETVGKSKLYLKTEIDRIAEQKGR